MPPVRPWITLLCLALLLAPLQAGQAVKLNRFGHMDLSGDASPFRTASGCLVGDFNRDYPPVQLSFCDRNDHPLWSRTFDRTINLELSQNEHYAAFFDGRHLCVLDLISGAVSLYPPALIFTLDNAGLPAFYDQNSRHIVYHNRSWPIERQPLDILFYRDDLLIACRNGLYLAGQNRLESVYEPVGVLFQAGVIEDHLYLVERRIEGRSFHFALLKSPDLETFTPVDRVVFPQPEGLDAHDPIRAPLHYWESSFNSLVKNDYAQIQEWEHAYLHPGVDFFEEPYTEAYSVASGVVRAILTTGDEQYWRIAIERFDVPEEGYLYAHLNQESFPFVVGDTVQAGDVVGTLFPAWEFSPHCHFARISPDVPGAWNGVWWTVDNPLVDVTNMTDSLPPVFENALGSALFAFRTPEGQYLNPLELSGEIDVIARVVDYACSVAFDSRIVPYDLKFRVRSALNPDSVLYERYSFALDMPLDTYFSLYYYTLVLNTIYSRDAVCFTTNNNLNRDFFFILTNSNGDSVITEQDSSQVLDTTLLPDGPCLFEVIVRDCALNQTSALMPIVIDNGVPVVSDPEASVQCPQTVLLTVAPNPANPVTVATLELRIPSFINLRVYNLSGRLVKVLSHQFLVSGSHFFSWDAKDVAAGMYVVQLVAGEMDVVKRVVIAK